MAYDASCSDYLLKQPKTKEIVEELIELNEGLVGAQLTAFNLHGDPDAISYGFEGLFNAVNTYDHSKKIVFSTYATVCIRNNIQNLLRKRKSEQRTPTVSFNESVPGTEGITYEDLLYVLDKTDLYDNSNLIVDIVRKTLSSYKNTKTHDILRIWIESGFKATEAYIATTTGVSQPYVNKVINQFRDKLRIKLKEVI